MKRHLLFREVRPELAIGISCISFALIAAADYVTPREISTSVFYLVPISISAWFAGKYSGLVMAVLTALAWTGKDILLRAAPYSEDWILIWNTSVRLLIFSIVALLISEVRLLLKREQQQARIDGLTGLLNARTFRSQLAFELERARRLHEPLSLAYLDLDNFKGVNDTLGHAEGDRVLCVVAQTLTQELRKTDFAGRIGGDEFAVLLPATDSQNALITFNKLMNALRAKIRNWPIGCSVGAITCTPGNKTAEQLLEAADRLMYEVKSKQKNDVIHRLV